MFHLTGYKTPHKSNVNVPFENLHPNEKERLCAPSQLSLSPKRESQNKSGKRKTLPVREENDKKFYRPSINKYKKGKKKILASARRI